MQFVLTGIVWGSSFLFIAVALTGMTPPQVAWSRLVFGATALGIVVLVRRETLPRSLRVWGHLVVLALSFCVVPYLLFAWRGSEHVQDHAVAYDWANATPDGKRALASYELHTLVHTNVFRAMHRVLYADR